MKNVLITGGTGFIGRALCARLVESNFQLYILTRKNKSKLLNYNNMISYISSFGDLGNTKIDVIINLAGESISQRWTTQAKENIFSSRISTTRNLVDYIKSTSVKPELLISGSAVGYYGTDPIKVFDEETNIVTDKNGFAQYLCQSWEKEAKEVEKLGVRVVLLRIGPVESVH